jgi:hypothetical protein
MSPVVELKNGIRIANFSSPHPFKFDDGTILPACSPERAKALMLESTEREIPRGRWTDIELEFSLSDSVRQAVRELELRTDIDIILVPFPVLEALEKAECYTQKCRVVRVADRVNKTIYSDKFCC